MVQTSKDGNTQNILRVYSQQEAVLKWRNFLKMLRLKSSVSQSKNSLNIDAVNVVHTWIVMKNFLIEKSMNYGSIYERKLDLKRGFLNPFF